MGLEGVSPSPLSATLHGWLAGGEVMGTVSDSIRREGGFVFVWETADLARKVE